MKRYETKNIKNEQISKQTQFLYFQDKQCILSTIHFYASLLTNYILMRLELNSTNTIIPLPPVYITREQQSEP